jgi:hypothetical protein
VIVLIQEPAASGFKHLLHTAANQFFCLPLQTRGVLVEVQVASSVHENRLVLLHRPASHLHQNQKPFHRKDLAPGGHPKLWPPLHVGFLSARWLLCRSHQTPKLEATKRHPVGHLSPLTPALTATPMTGNSLTRGDSGAPLGSWVLSTWLQSRLVTCNL